MKKQLLIFDFNNTLMRGMFVHSDLSYNDKFTGGIYGFVNIISSQIDKYKPTDIIICNDSPPYIRKKLYSEYKANRKKMESDKYQELQQTKQYCKDFLKLLNITLWSEKGQEADDLIAILCDEFASKYEKITIVSNDSDLYQLFKFHNVSLSKSKIIYSRKNFKNDYPNLSLKEWICVNALVGTHNGVIGIKGIGEKTAIKIIKSNTQDKVALEKNYNFSLAKKLITLPLNNNYVIPEITKIKFNSHKFMYFLNSFGIKMQNNMKRAFESIT